MAFLDSAARSMFLSEIAKGMWLTLKDGYDKGDLSSWVCKMGRPK